MKEYTENKVTGYRERSIRPELRNEVPKEQGIRPKLRTEVAGYRERGKIKTPDLKTMVKDYRSQMPFRQYGAVPDKLDMNVNIIGCADSGSYLVAHSTPKTMPRLVPKIGFEKGFRGDRSMPGDLPGGMRNTHGLDTFIWKVFQGIKQWKTQIPLHGPIKAIQSAEVSFLMCLFRIND